MNGDNQPVRTQFIPFLRAPGRWITYPRKPVDAGRYREKMNRVYSRFASSYDNFIRLIPAWNRWIGTALPEIVGRRILEVGFGPAPLFAVYPDEFELYGLDYNRRMVRRAAGKLAAIGRRADLRVGDVGQMPYTDGFFDTVITTMAFSGFPDGRAALGEMMRVLHPGGVVIIVDWDYPEDRNLVGVLLVKAMIASGDLIKDMDALLGSIGYDYTHEVVGGCGAVHRYVIRKGG